MTLHQKLTVIGSSGSTFSESVSQASGINGSEEGVETSTSGGFDNVLTGCEGGRNQEDPCDGFEELHVT